MSTIHLITFHLPLSYLNFPTFRIYCVCLLTAITFFKVMRNSPTRVFASTGHTPVKMETMKGFYQYIILLMADRPIFESRDTCRILTSLVFLRSIINQSAVLVYY